MDSPTTTSSCADCRLPLRGPGETCKCLPGLGFADGVEPAGNEVRFAPIDDEGSAGMDGNRTTIAGASPLNTDGSLTFDSRPDMDTTIVRRSVRTEPGFGQFADSVRSRPSASRALTSAVTGFAKSVALVSMAAFVGGVTVLYFQPVQPTPSQSQITPKGNHQQAVTDIPTSGPFINKAAQDAPLVPEESTRPAHVRDERVQPRSPAGQDRTAIQPVPDVPEDDKEAKVGAYVAENRAVRKPTARCADGTYSFAASRDQACVGRGGPVDSSEAPAKVPARPAAYVLGPRGGCYYLEASGKKNYVDRKYCN